MIEVRTKYTKKAIRKYHWFHSYKKMPQKIMTIVFSIAYLFMLYSVILSFFTTGDLSGVFSKAVFIIGMPALFLVAPIISTNNMLKKSSAYFGSGSTFTFYEDHFTGITVGGAINSTSEINYAALVKAYETKAYFYLYLQPSQAYVIDKQAFTQGTPGELSALLRKALPEKKFKVYKK